LTSLGDFTALKASSQTSLPAAAAAAAVVVAVVARLLASPVCQPAMFVARSGLEAGYAQPLSTSVVEPFLETRLDRASPGDLRTSVDLIMSLCWTDDEASEVAASIVVDVETAKAGAAQPLGKGLVQSGDVP
jgi:hypothetical protein